MLGVHRTYLISVSVCTDTDVIGVQRTSVSVRVGGQYTDTAHPYTPMFLINGVLTSANELWTLSDWQSVIDPILASGKSFSLKAKYVSD